MNGKSPITKSDNKIFLSTPNILQQMTTVIIICDILLIPFTYIFKQTPYGQDSIIFIWILAIAFTIGVFGFKNTFIFDSTQKQIFVKGTLFFIPYTHLLHNYSDISEIGVKTKTYYYKGKTVYVYYLVYSTKNQPNKYKNLASSEGIKHVLTLNDFNMMAQLLVETVGCSYKEFWKN